MTKDRRLGKGLAALLGTPLEEVQPLGGNPARGDETRAPDRSAGALYPNMRGQDTKLSNPTGFPRVMQLDTSSDEPVQGVSLEIDVSQIDNNPFQPRRQFNEEELDSLAESLKEHQQLQPVLVRRVGQRYQLISGERRLRAAIRAGFKKVRAEVREADDRLVSELAIVENLQRKDLNPIEKAMSFRRYLDEHRCSQEELAKRLKIDRSTIANLMRLLELPDLILQAVQADTVSAGHARALLPLGDESLQMRFCKQIQEEQWSVRETERRVSEYLAKEDADEVLDRPAPVVSRKKAGSPQIAALEQELKSALGAKVEIKSSSGGKGRIVVQFTSELEFERLREILLGSSGSSKSGRAA